MCVNANRDFIVSILDNRESLRDYALFPHMNVADNVAFALTMRDVPRAEITERVADALELVELSGMGQRFPRQLSGGQQQGWLSRVRSCFAPSVLLLDEPLGALDRMLREHMQIELVMEVSHLSWIGRSSRLSSSPAMSR